ncbi:MAG TPA: type II toxin-antitoxin system PemK/MazF family toxin [Phycisphaerae bacterium]|nr:type II toxin-antitoxin system PemK/MazF family toxin [Phycisphaerae bacterium]HPC21863.1 type II toxin-antitoxin system PemK/MazF family toxin [Phycisphaerae bacterium]HRT41376.1 type II toxin-antitoxin system PemK/MazF family toxin [Phycisphaerae bacterium]
MVFPFTDTTGGKLRPALVVSGPKFNQDEDFTAVPISSRFLRE